MKSESLSFAGRIALAFGTFLAILGDGRLAARIRDLRVGPAEVPVTPASAAPVAAPAPAPLRGATPDAALQLLGLFQREARFMDFIQEDMAAYGDADVGAAARLVHEGCRKVMRENFSVSPVRDAVEGSTVTLPAGFDAALVRLTGRVVGEAPFRGQLTHRGWQVVDVRLPKLSDGHRVDIVASAEVEL